MAQPAAVPQNQLQPGDFLGSIADDDLVYFLCNIGDGDAQLVLLPQFGGTQRQLVVVDAGRTNKLTNLVDELQQSGLLPPNPPAAGGGPRIALMVATHPHSDHIRGLPQLLQAFDGRVSEFWEPGYFHTTAAYHDMMTAVEASAATLVLVQPTSGMRRWIGNVAITVLAPSIQLKNRFDTYGVEINDSSISLQIEFPAARVVQRGANRELLGSNLTTKLILGADAQTLSWSYVMSDFPQLHTSGSAAAQAIRAATGGDLLRGQVLKVSHHASKHGINLELVERIAPGATLVSSVAGGGQHNFPHTIAQDAIREGLEPTTSGQGRSADHLLGIQYTSNHDDQGTRLGSIAIVISPNRQRRIWRFGDGATHRIRFANAREWS